MILGGGAVLLGVFLLVGYLLPSDWQAEAAAEIPAPPAVVLEFVDSPEGWQKWTPWPESGVERSGPERGSGAMLAWNDLELGSGRFTIVEMTPGRVTYSVLIDDGAIRADGSVEVTPAGEGSRVTWREAGDFGWNPLMGYWALSMSRAQTDEMAKGLERLRRLAVGVPADSLVAHGVRVSPSP
jgi:carbon monoxide dehydrogenase subunit G